jgi:hypothetical protein
MRIVEGALAFLGGHMARGVEAPGVIGVSLKSKVEFTGV